MAPSLPPFDIPTYLWGDVGHEKGWCASAGSVPVSACTAGLSSPPGGAGGRGAGEITIAGLLSSSFVPPTALATAARGGASKAPFDTLMGGGRSLARDKGALLVRGVLPTKAFGLGQTSTRPAPNPMGPLP